MGFNPKLHTMVDGLSEFIREHSIDKDEYGRLVMYKAVLNAGAAWFSREGSAGAYMPGTEVRVGYANRNRTRLCARGLHVATLRCATLFLASIIGISRGHIIMVKVFPEDVKCVPHLSLNGFVADAKVRCSKLYVQEIVGRSID